LRKYQLVLQFTTTSLGLADLDTLVRFEEELISHLPAFAQVDGHDSGRGELNIFIMTDHPAETFEAAEVLRNLKLPEHVPFAAYREVLGEDYIVLWPPGQTKFELA
jgi:hypothetical protein